MRLAPLALIIATAFFGVGFAGWTQDVGTGKKPEEQEAEKTAESKAKSVAFSKMRIKWHRLNADLIEAQLSADDEKIAALGKEIGELEKRIADEFPGWGRHSGRHWRRSWAGYGRGPDGEEIETRKTTPGSDPGPGRGPGLEFGSNGSPRADRGPDSDAGPGSEPGDSDRRPPPKGK